MRFFKRKTAQPKVKEKANPTMNIIRFLSENRKIEPLSYNELQEQYNKRIFESMKGAML